MIHFENMHKAVEFYVENGFRPMPLHGIEDRCQHRPIKPELDCKGQCWGKVPKQEHWPDKDFFTTDHFPSGCNLALIMGEQLDGRWFAGLDLDGYLDLDKFLELPPTLECITARGRHLIYEVPADTPLGNWNDILSTRSKTAGYRLDYKGALDLKYCRGAMASPPSINKHGKEYEWTEWRRPEMLPASEIAFMIRKRKSAHPNVPRYRTWSANPAHKNKRA